MIYKYDKIFYDGNVMEKSDITNIMMASPEAYRLYSESMSSSKGITGLMTGGIVCTALTVWSIYIHKKGRQEHPIASIITSPLSIALITVSGAGSAILFAAAASKKQMANRYLNQAVNHYNWEMNQIKKQDQSYIEVCIGTNGIGLVYNF